MKPRQEEAENMDGMNLSSEEASGPASGRAGCSGGARAAVAPITVPAPRTDCGRDYEEELRLSLISDDDVEFKKKAIEFFVAGELANNACGEEIDRTMAEDRRLAAEIDLTRALTPGGIAWRLSEAVRVMENE
jgi:hypothetical protein